MNLGLLKTILNSSIVEDAIDTSIPNSPSIYLKETGITKLSKIKLHLPNAENLIFKLDKELRLRASGRLSSNKSLYLNPDLSGIHSGCDYVVMSKIREKVWINFIELKSDSTAGAHSQLYYSIPHVEYFLSLLKHHQSCKFDFEYKFILFSTRMGNIKTITKPGQISKVDLINSKTGYKCYLPGAPPEFYLSTILT